MVCWQSCAQLSLRTFHGSRFVEEGEKLSPYDGILRIRNLACVARLSSYV